MVNVGVILGVKVIVGVNISVGKDVNVGWGVSVGGTTAIAVAVGVGCSAGIIPQANSKIKIGMNIRYCFTSILLIVRGATFMSPVAKMRHDEL